MKNNSPYFSIVIPTYNRAELLSETIDTIVLQRYDNYEIIIVDDGSTDGTEDVIKKSYGANPQISYYWKENEERGKARNFGFDKAKGTYVLFFDSDDLMQENHLEILRDYIDRLSQPNFIAAKHLIKTESGESTFNSSKHLKEGWYTYKDLIIGNWLACHFCVRKDNPNLIHFEEDRDYAILEDWMYLMMNLFSDKLFLIDKFTIHSRMHDGRSMNNNKLIVERREKATEYLLNRLDFNETDSNQIQSQSFYFCAIHSYLEKEKNQAISFLNKARKIGGLSKGIFILYLKLFLGYYPKSIK